MKEDKAIAPQINNKQKKQLRALGHHIDPVVYVGREGISPALLRSTQAALLAHELIKVKIGKNAPLKQEDAAASLSELCAAALVQIIGRMIVLYRPNPDLPEAKRVSM